MVNAHKLEMILKWHEDGVTVTRTASLLGISEAEVIDVIRTGGKPAATKPEPLAIIDVPLFDD